VGDLFFLFRVMLLSALVVVLMQIQVGDKTLETRAQIWLQSGEASSVVKEVAKGGAEFVRRSARSLVQSVDATWKDWAGDLRSPRSSSRSVERSSDRSADGSSDRSSKKGPTPERGKIDSP